MDETTDGGVVARRATVAEIFQLRRDVLRAGLPVEAAQFPGDDLPATIHVGAFAPDGRNVGCATGTLNHWEGRPAWQLRGMAVAPDWQRRGVGQRVLAELERLVREQSDVRLLWCNAREVALAFYKAQGWRIESERFVIETAGPHYKMTRGI
jgi:GNAT superfamily N-acetyltransferase